MLQYWRRSRYVYVRQQCLEDSHGRGDCEGWLGSVTESPGHQGEEFSWMRHAVRSWSRILSRCGISKTCEGRMHVACTVDWEREARGKELIKGLSQFSFEKLLSVCFSALPLEFGEKGAFLGKKWHDLLALNGKERGKCHSLQAIKY